MKRLAVFILFASCLAGIFLGAYSIYEHILVKSGIETTGSLCNINATMNCRGVIQSKWSSFLGLPIGAYGIGFYFFCLFSYVWYRIKDSEVKLLSPAFLFSAISVLLSFFLFYVSKVHIGVLCPVCLSMYLVNALIFLSFYVLTKEAGVIGSVRSAFSSFTKLPVVFLLSALAVFASPDLVKSVAKKVVVQEQLQLTREQQIERAFKIWVGTNPIEIASSDEPDRIGQYSTGDGSEPVQVVEFFDFECPACRNFYGELKELLADFQGKVNVSYRNYPLDNTCNPAMQFPLHKSACYLAELSRCAGEQGRYLDVVDAIMRLSEIDEEAAVAEMKTALEAELKQLGVDEMALQECLQSDRQLSNIRKDISVATELDLSGTPSLWVNGKAVPAVSTELLRIIFNDILKKKVVREQSKEVHE